MDNLNDTWKKILGDIADALELDQKSKHDLINNIFYDYQSHKAIELGVFTSRASQRKVVWHYLARFLVPTLARHSVFWQIESRLDVGMPGGRFWYLPAVDCPFKPTLLLMPIQQVLNWLIDLIGDSSANIANRIVEGMRAFDSTDVVLKNLYNWRKAKSTPEISSIINTFPDEVEIRFRGTFELDDKFPKFEQALAFVKAKGLSASALQHEIAISKEMLERILCKKCSIEEQDIFVREVASRYQAPSIRTVRLRLLLARATQEGYEKLVKFLTPNVDKQCLDLNTNKALQLIQLYNDVYNRTYDAHLMKRGAGEAEENKYFTEQLSTYLRYDLLRYVCYDTNQPIEITTHKLNNIFRQDDDGGLENIIPTTNGDRQRMISAVVEELKSSEGYHAQLAELLDALKRNKALFRNIQAIDDFDMIYGALEHGETNHRIRALLFDRLKELEASPDQSMKRIIAELEELLLVKAFTASTEEKVSILLAEAKASEVLEYSKARILQLEGLHLLGQNKFLEAEKGFNLAIDECKKYSFGKLRGSLAKDAFSLAVANQKLIPNNHEKYYRDMYYWGGINSELYSLDKVNIHDVARDLHEYFWATLYKCYPDYEPKFASCRTEFEKFSKSIASCIKAQKPISTILSKYSGLKNKQLKYPQADSIVLLIMKISYDMSSKLRSFSQALPVEAVNELNRANDGLIGAVREIIQEWPEIVDVSDFKQQTPLMMAAHNQDYKTVELLLNAKANPNLRDLKGRTALHSAAASRCLLSAKLLLEHGIDETIVTIEGATPLHTATRMGELPIVKLLIEKCPELLQVSDLKGITPAELAASIAEDRVHYELLRQYLESEKRVVVSYESYKQVAAYYSSLK